MGLDSIPARRFRHCRRSSSSSRRRDAPMRRRHRRSHRRRRFQSAPREALLGQRRADEGFELYFGGSAHPPFKSREEAKKSPLFDGHSNRRAIAGSVLRRVGEIHASLQARDLLLRQHADGHGRHALDAIVHKAVEHQPTLIRDGVNRLRHPKGAPHINTYLRTVPSIVVPAGFAARQISRSASPSSAGPMTMPHDRLWLRLRAGDPPPPVRRRDAIVRDNSFDYVSHFAQDAEVCFSSSS